ncbi:Alpha/beta hydrolase family protein [Microlunatus soli]|uniref:Alpha/beta hydrolase family protein n=1 Tax=Microlunatus soli TaxID=630515 RepID=A0A1H1ZZB6_9ACTN|nr:Alpha/beta hydrolase family protein [Microlunatus soli]
MRSVGRVLGWIGGGLITLLVLGMIAIVVYGNVGVRQAESVPLATVRNDPRIDLVHSDGAWVMTPTDGQAAEGQATDGLVFIPGAKVDPLAYASMLAGLVREGVTVIITKPTLNLAFFDLRRLTAFTALAPWVQRWAVGGHSLGGVRACQLVGGGGVQTLVLFASYCARDISGTDVRVLSVSGSRDGLSTPTKINNARPLLPADAESVVIDGANHASFGAYGDQPGDGTATESSATVQAEIDDAVLRFLTG